MPTFNYQPITWQQLSTLRQVLLLSACERNGSHKTLLIRWDFGTWTPLRFAERMRKNTQWAERHFSGRKCKRSERKNSQSGSRWQEELESSRPHSLEGGAVQPWSSRQNTTVLVHDWCNRLHLVARNQQRRTRLDDLFERLFQGQDNVVTRVHLFSNPRQRCWQPGLEADAMELHMPLFPEDSLRIKCCRPQGRCCCSCLCRIAGKSDVRSGCHKSCRRSWCNFVLFCWLFFFSYS